VIYITKWSLLLQSNFIKFVKIFGTCVIKFGVWTKLYSFHAAIFHGLNSILL